jgi:hypothetical protein
MCNETELDLYIKFLVKSMVEFSVQSDSECIIVTVTGSAKRNTFPDSFCFDENELDKTTDNLRPKVTMFFSLPPECSFQNFLITGDRLNNSGDL